MKSAQCSAVYGFDSDMLDVFTSAPFEISSSTTWVRPRRVASYSGVRPELLYASTSVQNWIHRLREHSLFPRHQQTKFVLERASILKATSALELNRLAGPT